MLNYLWGFMILIGLAIGIMNGNVEDIGNAAIDSAGEAVSLAITMLGIMAMWTGLIEIAKVSGLMEKLTKKMGRLLHFLFPEIPKGHIVNEYLASNVMANVLCLGWAATPMGLKAMKELAELERSRRVAKQEGIPLEKFLKKYTDEERKKRTKEVQITKASDEMCTFLVLNISSLQVIPVSIIAYRSQYGSVNPAAIVLPGLIATTISTLAAIIFCKIISKKSK